MLLRDLNVAMGDQCFLVGSKHPKEDTLQMEGWITPHVSVPITQRQKGAKPQSARPSRVYVSPL